MRVLLPTCALATILALAGARAIASQASDDAECRPYFGNACSDAVGMWLPHFAAIGSAEPAAPTKVVDEIVDPAGRGEPEFLGQHSVYGGTFFVYGLAGPPRGHAIYDAVHHIAYYDEGCCSWHHVVLASNVKPPPKGLVSRSLVALRTKCGIKLGDPPSRIRATYGPAPFLAVAGAPEERRLRYVRALVSPGMSPPCDATTTFLFERGRLVGMDFSQAC
jgi:hypothetical protein